MKDQASPTLSFNINPMPREVKVAVIGSGLAGLTAAYLLTKPTPSQESDVVFDVHLFEKASPASVVQTVLVK